MIASSSGEVSQQNIGNRLLIGNHLMSRMET
jgi:hypothetical protein